MRLTIFALVLLPLGAQAQNTTDPNTIAPAQNNQSCAIGMVWDSGSQTCVAEEQAATPLQSLPGGHDCGGAARSVTS